MSVCDLYPRGVAHRISDCGLWTVDGELCRTMADIIYHSAKGKRKRREGGWRRDRASGEGRVGRGCCGRCSFQSISFVIVIDIL